MRDVYIYVCVHTCTEEEDIGICASGIYMYLCVSIWRKVCVYMCVCLCMCVPADIFMYVCVCVKVCDCGDCLCTCHCVSDTYVKGHLCMCF